MAIPIVTISKKISGGEELVVVKKKDFGAFQRWQREVDDALAKVMRGREEYKKKKTLIASSPHKFR